MHVTRIVPKVKHRSKFLKNFTQVSFSFNLLGLIIKGTIHTGRKNFRDPLQVWGIFWRKSRKHEWPGWTIWMQLLWRHTKSKALLNVPGIVVIWLNVELLLLKNRTSIESNFMLTQFLFRREKLRQIGRCSVLSKNENVLVTYELKQINHISCNRLNNLWKCIKINLCTQSFH